MCMTVCECMPFNVILLLENPIFENFAIVFYFICTHTCIYWYLLKYVYLHVSYSYRTDFLFFFTFWA